MRDLIAYFLRPIVRPLTRMFVRVAAVPACHFLFRRVSTLDRLDEEAEKDIIEWLRGSLLLLLATANMEKLVWHTLLNMIPWRSFADLLDKHEWVGVGLRILLAITVVQTMPDQELFSIIHPGPKRAPLPPGTPWRIRFALQWRWIARSVICTHLNRSSPVFAILTVIFDGTVGWVCYFIAIAQYLFIGLVTSRDRAANVLTLFDRRVAARRRELVRQIGVINEITAWDGPCADAGSPEETFTPSEGGTD